MKTFGLIIAVVLMLGAQSPAAGSTRHLVYEFGYNTKVASSGNGTGTTTIDIGGTAPDGGVMISGQDYWWNTARPRATNTCEVHPNGGVACLERPYAISPMQLTIFPLLARQYFAGLGANGTSKYTNTFNVKAAIVPGANGFAGALTTWACVYHVQGKGLIPNGGSAVLVETNGTLDQQGGRYRSATSKQHIAFDPAGHTIIAVRDVRTHLPQTNVYNNDLIELKLIKDSHGKPKDINPQ